MRKLDMRASDVIIRTVPQRYARVDVDSMERVLTGQAIVFNSLSQDLGGFKERIAPSAVDRTLREGTNVDALQDHRLETTTILGSTDSGSLRLAKERTGLKVKITPPDTGNARDLITVVKAGLAKGMSFAFRVMPDGQEWHEEDGQLIRTVTDMVFSEVSIVVNPAYLQTEISARNLQIDRRALEEFQGQQRMRRVQARLREIKCETIEWELKRGRSSLAMREKMIRAGMR